MPTCKSKTYGCKTTITTCKTFAPLPAPPQAVASLR